MSVYWIPIIYGVAWLAFAWGAFALEVYVWAPRRRKKRKERLADEASMQALQNQLSEARTRLYAAYAAKDEASHQLDAIDAKIARAAGVLYLQASIAAVEGMLTRLHPERVLERISMEGHLKQMKTELASLEVDK